jgi:hypothetical protein
MTPGRLYQRRSMSIPEIKSAEAFWRYAGEECLFEGRGEA